MIKNFNAKNAILLGYSVPIISLLSLSFLSYTNNQRISKVLQENENAQSSTELINAAHIGVSRADRAMRGYMLTGQDKSRQSYETGMDNFHESVDNLTKIVENSEQKNRLKKIVELSQGLEEFNNKIIGLIKAGKSSDALKLFETRQGINILRELEDLTEEFSVREKEMLAVKNKNTQSDNQFLALVNGLSTLLSIVLCLGIAYRISSKLLAKITQAATNVTSSAREIATTVEQQQHTVALQASSVNQTSTTMNELGASSRQAAQQAEDSAISARQALKLAEGGTQAIESTMDGITNLREKVTAIAEQILHLSEQTGQIANISDLVRDIANQTNMLALNAAVEAARAGDRGKGFSVVATEIRKLADESKQSAEKINTLVQDLQTAMNSTVIVTDEGSKTAEDSLKLARSSVEAFKGMTEAIDNVFVNNQQISLSAKQQAIAVQEVLAAMDALNLGARETTTGITQVKSSTHLLAKAAEELKQMSQKVLTGAAS